MSFVYKACRQKLISFLKEEEFTWTACFYLLFLSVFDFFLFVFFSYFCKFSFETHPVMKNNAIERYFGP